MDKQPEALRLADKLDQTCDYNTSVAQEAADELRRLHQHEIAYEIWSDKTHWVQETCKSHELGMHRADVLKKRIDHLHQVNQELVEALEKLARLGNGDQCGNSEGNIIARAALNKHKEQA